MAASQPKVATQALTTLAIPSPMQAAAAHSRASGQENRGAGGVEWRSRGRVLADGLMRGPNVLPGEQTAQQASRWRPTSTSDHG